LQEGRVVIDRDSLWPALKREEADVLATAAVDEETISRRADEAVAAARRRL
jgi:hypothetical protein